MTRLDLEMSEEAAKMTGGEIAASLRSSQRRDTLAVIIRKSDRRSNEFFFLRAKRSKLNWNPHSGPPFTPSYNKVEEQRNLFSLRGCYQRLNRRY